MGGNRTGSARRLRRLALVVAVAAVAAATAVLRTALAASVTAASFSGGAGTVSVGGTLYARSGGALTLTVTTSSDTTCVELSGAFTARQTSSTARSTWTFPLTAGSGDGVQTVTAAASPSFNANSCTGQSKTPQSASFVLDNTGPAVTGAVSPAANAAGWNNGNVSIAWSASDAGSGVASGPTPASDSQSANTAGVTKTATATDRLGNLGSGSVTVKLDKAAPTITGDRSPAANANGWNSSDVTVSFTCSDGLSGIKSCSGPTTLTTGGASQSVTGTAVDTAGNATNATVSNVNIDKVAPALGGAPTTSPNAAGWYNGDVTVHWTASDALSGLAAGTPADSTISSEGTGLTVSRSVSDRAGNTTSATSSPAVRIDKTAPNTTATAPTTWNNTDVSVTLVAGDALSGVTATHYAVDGAAVQTGTHVAISDEGTHSLAFWSVDAAGNVEQAKTVEIKIDKTPPTITHTQAPAANANGWNAGDVKVTFTCTDPGGSGIDTCTAPQTVTGEGRNHAVTGAARDNAGNTATDPATVSIDRTPPTIAAAADRAANANGWYRDDVVVGFSCGDALSGIDLCPAPKTLGEGAGQSAGGTATDAAGNTASDAVTGIDVDETAPSLHGAPTTAPNANGWYSGDVTVHWTASDDLSGLDGDAPADATVDGEGGNLSASASVSDRAGNSTSATVDGIQIDRTAPSTSASVPDPLASGWYAGPVEVTLHAVDHLSGVTATHYRIDDGPVQTPADTSFSLAEKGVHTITFWSVDAAGNVEDADAPGHAITLRIDGVPPTITGSRLPAANGFGWNNAPVTVSFACTDAESGIAGCSDPITLLGEGAGQSVTGQAVDNAGNTNSAAVSDVNIDLTNPTLTGAATTDPNAFGWYKGDVVIHWSGQDGLSGIDPATQPDDSVISGEGADLGAGPVTIADQAGNVGTASVSGIKVDRTPPTIAGATVNDDGTARSANASGWFNGAVRIRFTCDDALSGVQECAKSDVVLDHDGADQSASGTATDNADNAATATVSGVNIDSKPPTTIADLQCTRKNGYCSGSKATVVLTAADQAGLSGVHDIRYSVDNGQSWQTVAGASASVDLDLSGSGDAKVLFRAVDNAGNNETPNGVEIAYDTIAPTVTHTLSPASNAAGWNHAPTLVHFDATDDSDGSGVDPATVTPDQTISGETLGTLVKGSAQDLAGNLGTDAVTVKLDKTPPAISAAATTQPNANGWYGGPVTVRFTCTDQGAVQSGITTCPSDVILSTDGPGQSATGTARDRADNAASAGVSGIGIDTVKPDLAVKGIADGAIYTLGAVPARSCTAGDAGSGLAGACSVAVSGGLANGVGTFSFTATATDKAGNTTTQRGTYRVIYRWDGVLQPINDTAHQIDPSTSIFKGGSTVPVKFQLKTADGTIVSAGNAPVWLNPQKGGLTTAVVDQTVFGDAGTSGTTFKWDATAQQYIYNWSTKGSPVGYYERIGVTLDDGQSYFVNIGLR